MPGRPLASHNGAVAEHGGARPGGSTSQIYRIRVQGHLSAVGAAWFDGLTVANVADGEAVLTGPIRDQAALMAVLRRVDDLGLTLLAVHRKPARRRAQTPRRPQEGRQDVP
jgi:hypothetical protein